ncbi:MAG: cytochrome c [Cyanobacteria bacterium P01_C01_bin.89]
MAIAGVVLVLGLVAGFLVWSKPMDPYVKGVLELTGDVDRGGDIFLMNCSTCHGFDATGRVGPSLQGVGDRKSQQQLIHQVVSGKTPPMPQFQPDTQDMADLLSYLQTL